MISSSRIGRAGGLSTFLVEMVKNKVVALSLTFAWVVESSQSEFVCSSYDQNGGVLRSLNLSPCLSLSSLPSCDLVSLYQHAHTMHHLESLLTISPDNLCLDNLDIFKEDLENQSLRRTLVTFTRAFIMSLSLSIEHEHAVMNLTQLE
ncbi:hypothetical protein Tco_0528682 [Tanacetum coccineum]